MRPHVEAVCEHLSAHIAGVNSLFLEGEVETYVVGLHVLFKFLRIGKVFVARVAEELG